MGIPSPFVFLYSWFIKSEPYRIWTYLKFPGPFLRLRVDTYFYHLRELFLFSSHCHLWIYFFSPLDCNSLAHISSSTNTETLKYHPHRKQSTIVNWIAFIYLYHKTPRPKIHPLYHTYYFEANIEFSIKASENYGVNKSNQNSQFKNH